MQEDEDNDLMKHQGVDTSILLHLFGRDGAGELEFKQFCTFMNNLQTEVIQIKLAEVSKGALPSLSLTSPSSCSASPSSIARTMTTSSSGCRRGSRMRRGSPSRSSKTS